MIKVISLISEEEFYYTDLSPEDALISAYLYTNKQISSLTNQRRRDEFKMKIIKSKNFLALGDLCVSKETQK